MIPVCRWTILNKCCGNGYEETEGDLCDSPGIIYLEVTKVEAESVNNRIFIRQHPLPLRISP